MHQQMIEKKKMKSAKRSPTDKLKAGNGKGWHDHLMVAMDHQQMNKRKEDVEDIMLVMM